jgi:GNAT superfamily N-acetyltransferase
MSIPEVTARQAVEPDLPVLVDLVQHAFDTASAQRGGELWLFEQAPREPLADALAAGLAADGRNAVLAGCVDGIPVGVMLVDRRALEDGREVARVSLVYVAADARGIGVGEALLDAATAWALDAGCVGLDGLALPGDRETKNLYERAGMSARLITVYRDLAP